MRHFLIPIEIAKLSYLSYRETAQQILKLVNGFLIGTKLTFVLFFMGNLARVKYLLSKTLRFLAKLIFVFLGILVGRKCLESRLQGLSDLVIRVAMSKQMLTHLDLFLFRRLQEHFPHKVFAFS